MLKFLQARLQQYAKHELPDVQAGFKKAEEPEIKLPTAKETLMYRSVLWTLWERERVRCMERVTWTFELPYIKWIVNGNLLYDSGSSNRGSVKI